MSGTDPPPFEARLKLVALQLHFYSDAEPLDSRVARVLDELDGFWQAPPSPSTPHDSPPDVPQPEAARSLHEGP